MTHTCSRHAAWDPQKGEICGGATIIRFVGGNRPIPFAPANGFALTVLSGQNLALTVLCGQNMALTVLYGQNMALTVLYGQNMALTVLYGQNMALTVLYVPHSLDSGTSRCGNMVESYRKRVSSKNFDAMKFTTPHDLY